MNRIQEKLNKITELTTEYYESISDIGHKDRDCHFSVNTIWSYGDLYFYPEHYGYINELEDKDIPSEVVIGGLKRNGFKTYEEALDFMIKYLENIIKKEKQLINKEN